MSQIKVATDTADEIVSSVSGWLDESAQLVSLLGISSVLAKKNLTLFNS